MSLRVFEKQSPNRQGDCFATCARNDMQTVRLASLWQLQSAMGEELSPPADNDTIRDCKCLNIKIHYLWL